MKIRYIVVEDLCFENWIDQLYSTAGSGTIMEFGRLKMRKTSSSLHHKVSEIKYCINQQSVCTKCHSSMIFKDALDYDT